jgi:hypothetical protein
VSSVLHVYCYQHNGMDSEYFNRLAMKLFQSASSWGLYLFPVCCLVCFLLQKLVCHFWLGLYIVRYLTLPIVCWQYCLCGLWEGSLITTDLRSLRTTSLDTTRPSTITTHHARRHNTPIHNILSTAPKFRVCQKALGTLPEDGNVMPKHVGATTHN